MKLHSKFAILDVTHGRKQLQKMMPAGSNSLPKDQQIPVTITGFISHQHGNDDGTSTEFGIDVSSVVVGENGKW